jgi:transcriptional regulator with XRE-family HTH domain
MDFGKKLTSILAERGITKAYMARRLDISPQLFQHITRQRDVKLTMAVRIANILELTVYDFLVDDNGR